MPLGPLQLVVIGFDSPVPDGSVLTELAAVREQGFIRLVDALGVFKDDDGNITAVQVSDLSEDEAILAGAAIGGLIGLGAGGGEGSEEGAVAGALRAAEAYEYGLDPEDIEEIAEDIPEGGAALLMLVEHTWLIPLRNAIRRQGGVILAQEFLSMEALIGIGAELAALEE